MSKTAKSVISCLVVVLIFTSLVGVLGFASKGFKDWNTKNWFQKEQVVEKPATPPAVVDGDGNDMTEGKVYDMPANMVFSSASPASVGNAITINAVVTPANASIKDLTWAINWQNAASTWATGKVITDYFTLTPNGQQSSISCLQAFGEKIVISVTSVDNPAAKAECVVDFAKRVSNVKLALKNSTNSVNYDSYYKKFDLDVLSNDTQNFVPEVTFDEGVGTISNTKTISYTLSSNFLAEQVIPCLSVVHNLDLDINNGVVFNREFFTKLFGASTMSGNELHRFNEFINCRVYEDYILIPGFSPSVDSTQFFEWRQRCVVFDIIISVLDNNTKLVETFCASFSISNFYDYIAVNSVSLSNNSLQF